MRKKQSHLLYIVNMPVHPAAFSFAIHFAKAGFCILAKYLLQTPAQSTSLHSLKNIHKPISLPTVNENTGELTGWQNR